MGWKGPSKRQQRLVRNLPLCLAAFTVLAPIMLFLATFPENNRVGYLGLPRGVRLATAAVLAALVLVALVLVVAFIKIYLRHKADREFVWGCGTLLCVLATVALFASAFLRRNVENRAWSLFLGLSAMCVATLVLVAQDWARRSLLVAAGVAGLALAAFIMRVGIEHATIPPQWDRVDIAAQAEGERVTLQDQFDQGAKGRAEDMAKARTKLAVVLQTEPPCNVARDLRAQAVKILQGVNGPRPTVPDAALQRFDVLLVSRPSTSPPAATALSDAVHALAAAVQAAAAKFDSAPLDRRICVVSGHKFVAPAQPCGQARDDPVTSHGAWLDAKHNLDVALASTRASVTDSPADKTALENLVAQVPGRDDQITMLSAVSNGPEAVWRSAFHRFDPAFLPGPLGWVIIGALLLGLLSWLLKLNARQLAGPVEIAANDKVNDDLITVLRVAVLQNVNEPGAAPGSPSVNPVTTLLGIAGGPLSTVSKIVQAVLSVVGRRHGYRVAIDVTGREVDKPANDGASPTGTDVDTPSTPAPTTVLIRVSELSSGATLASHTVYGASAKAAVREAGLWAAGYILDRSRRIPSWAAWEPDTAQALVRTKDGESPTLDDLKQAVREAPTSGLLLVLLGQRYELAGRRVEAIDCYARAVAVHPRYRVARYRLAVALAMMRHDKQWPGTLSPADRANDLSFVTAAILAQRVYVGRKLVNLCSAGLSPADASTNFTGLAKKLLKSLEKEARYPYRVVNALRRSERDALWSGLVPGPQSVTARFKGVVRSARLSLDSKKLRKLEKAAKDPSSWWQISYNAACGYATVSSSTGECKERALALLEQTLLRPGIHQLEADWVDIDPDLDSIRADARFTYFVKQLRAGAACRNQSSRNA